MRKEILVITGIALLILAVTTQAETFQGVDDLLEAQLIAIELEGELLPSQELTEQIYNDLATIRAEFPDFADIKYRPPASPYEILVGLTEGAMEQFNNGQYHALDDLNGLYGVIEIEAHTRFLVLRFERVYNTKLLANIYAEAAPQGLRYAEPNYIIGDGSTIYVSLPFYIFIRAWGDCPSGCIYRERDYFRVENGQVSILSGSIYFVDSNGNDNYNGLSKDLAFETIQRGINAANDGDIVIVAEGTYVENIRFGGKNIILTSNDPDDWSVVAGTVIDGSGGAGPVVLFAGTEEATGELAGFTITGGYNTENGGGVQGSGSYASISKCIITGNTTENTGGGVQYFNGDISNCKIIGNSSGMNGGGLAGCQGRIENCVVSNNTATTVGGGMNNCDGEIVNCTIANNSGGEGGGLRICDGTITNCIIWGNSKPEISNSVELSNSCFVGGSGTNIDSDPFFFGGGNYRLLADSPCIDAGTNSPVGGLPSTDIEGQSRPVDGDNDTIAVADMGAYETLASSEPGINPSESIFEFTAYEGGANPESQILEIRNGGLGILNWEITESCNWLSVDPVSGSSTGEPNGVTLSVDTSGLTRDVYNCELTVSAVGALNSPQIVEVRLRIRKILNVPAPYATIQAGIDGAIDGDIVIVAEGTYTGSGNRDLDFGGKAITVRSTDPCDRCVVAATIIDCEGIEDEPHRGFKFHSGEEPDSVVNGFTITNGYANKGGGIYCGENSSPTILACTISANSNSSFCGGGGIFCIDNSPVISHCTISGNVDLHYEDFGAAIVCESSNATIRNCIISENVYFGILCRQDSRVQIKDCMISRNEGYGILCRDETVITDSTVSQNAGTGIICEDDTTISNCTISGNEGKGIHCDDNNIIINCIIMENTFGGVVFGGNDSKIINSIIARNTAFEGAGIYCDWSYKTIVAHCTISNNSSIKSGGGIHCNGSIIYMSDCILWGNTAPKGPEVYVGTKSSFWLSSFSAWYNNVQGGEADVYKEEEGSQLRWFDGNINRNPRFVSSIDYHLQNDSPCIDTGTNNPRGTSLPVTDLDGNARIHDGNEDGITVVDMGAYEYRPPNTAPVADAGVDRVVYAGISGTADVELDGSGSYDADGDELEYTWAWQVEGNAFIVNGSIPVIELGVGEHEITLVVNDGLEDSEPNEVVITVVGPVEVDVRVMPRVLNGKSQGRYVLAVMQLPDGIGRDDIDENYGFVLEPGGIDATFWRVRRRRRESIVFAMFDRARLIDATEEASTGAGRVRSVEVSVAGKLISGGYIYGADVIGIIRPGNRPRPGGRHIRRGRL